MKVTRLIKEYVAEQVTTKYSETEDEKLKNLGGEQVIEYYYKLYKSSPYVGTDETILIRSKNEEYEIEEESIKEELLNDYGYLASGWNKEMTEEEEEEFKNSCEVSLTAISKETFDSMVEEDGYDVEED